MKTQPTARYGYRRTNLRSLTRIAAFAALLALIGIPLFSSSLASSSSEKSRALALPRLVNNKGAAVNSNGIIGNLLNTRKQPALLPFSPALVETINTFASDCTTARTTFFLGETVCAKTAGVTETDRFVNWIGPNGHAYGGAGVTDITTDPQNFLYTPTVLGLWKATIADPADSSIIPTDFTVVEPPPLATYADGCVIPKTTFVLGDKVCAKATGLVGYRFAWVDSAGFIRQRVDITTDPQTDTFILPSDPTTVVNDTIVDNRGEWRVNAITSRGSLKSSAFFTVTDPANAAVDLSITKTLVSDSPVENGPAQFSVTIINNGPDDAVNAHFVDNTFTNATFNSITQTDGPAFICSGSGVDCALAQFPKGAEAKFLLNFTAGVAGGDLQNTATISSDTAELNTLDNSFTTATIRIASGTPPPVCVLDCPDNITANADTTEGGNRGAHVTYDPPLSDPEVCGVVTTSPASGSFFPVGITTVTATSALNGGSCSFTVKVEDQGVNPPTISCPPNPPQANANGDCEATVTIGNPTVSGNNVTFSGVRSDGKPMYNCDCFPHNPDPDPNADVWECDIHGTCTRRADAPFAAGITTITWTAYSHNIAGPYASPDAEEAARTGSASCQQTVIVNDVAPPVITAVNQTVSADATCQAAVPDYTNSVTDNCSCASNDTSQDCVGQHVITLTQDVAAGTLLGPGAYTIHLSANDGSSNNGGAGNTTNKTIIFTVRDTTAPAIICPLNIITNTDPGLCSAVVNPGTATATDNCDTSPTVTGTRSDSQPLNAPYPKGTTTITWTATDDANNSSSCVQTVTVNDTENPTISCPANITKDNDPGVCGAVVTYTAPVGSDNCPGATTAQTAGLPSGATFPVGTTTNTFEVTDASGNKTSCSFTVTVNDTENPTISCPVSFTLEPTCPSGAVGTYTTPVGADNCPGAVTTLTAGLASGSVFPIGTTTVTYSVTDGHGNGPVSCSFTVTVKTVAQTITDLKNSVNSSSLSGTQKQGLIAKLSAAEDALAQGHPNTACQKLADFINSTQNFINHGNISAAVGNAWIRTAAHIRNTIGCTNLPCS